MSLLRNILILFPIFLLLGCVSEMQTDDLDIDLNLPEEPKNETAVKPLPSGFCGSSTNGPCQGDIDCKAGGCSGQLCQAKIEPSRITTCEYRYCYDAESYGLECKCVQGGCQWG
jgi:eight-cysteine-cluster-containing protein